MDVAPGEKIDIVGRTGAENLSIMTAPYQLVELPAGYILIDGVDIPEISLKNVRWSGPPTHDRLGQSNPLRCFILLHLPRDAPQTMVEPICPG
jgi:hypothetical protein